MIVSELPTHPWEKVASDLFYLNGKTYILVVDYFSRYLEVQSMSSTTSGQTVQALKAIFSRHGIPSTFVSDNGTQYASEEMVAFARGYNFTHITSSPHYSQGNGFAERMVRTVKSLLSKSPSDPYLALLRCYRCTPTPWVLQSFWWGDSSGPTYLSIRKSWLLNGHTSQPFERKTNSWSSRRSQTHDKCHRVRLEPTLAKMKLSGSVHKTTWTLVRCTACSIQSLCIIQTPSAMLRHNQSHLTRQSGVTTDQADTATTNTGNNDQHRVIKRSQTGANVGPPSRLAYWRKGDVVCS